MCRIAVTGKQSPPLEADVWLPLRSRNSWKSKGNNSSPSSRLCSSRLPGWVTTVICKEKLDCLNLHAVHEASMATPVCSFGACSGVGARGRSRRPSRSGSWRRRTQNRQPSDPSISQPCSFDEYARQRKSGGPGCAKRHREDGRDQGGPSAVRSIRAERIAGVEVGARFPRNSRDRGAEILALILSHRPAPLQ